MDAAYREKVDKILTAAAAAPSGDNSQPWRFVVHDGSIEFHFLPERDNSLLNYEEGGTLIALGAALQNAEIEAQAQGYIPRVTLSESGSCVAVMNLDEGGQLDSALSVLHGAIHRRHTNRKAYKKGPLASEVRAAILEQSSSPEANLSLIESSEIMQIVARALTTMEETALGNKTLHRLFFGDIFWSDADNRAGKQGLHIKTLELPPPAQAMFKALRYWCIAKTLATLGFPKLVAKMNATQNASASAFGVITSTQTNRSVYIEVGKLLERIWLLATARGLSLQIVTGITFLARSVGTPEAGEFFNDAEKRRVIAAYAAIKNQIAEEQTPVLVFRVGVGGDPTEVSYRRKPEIVFI